MSVERLTLGGLMAKRSTPIERLVVVWTVIVGLVAIGAYCVYAASNPTPDKAEAAAGLRTIGWSLIASGAGAWVVYRAVSWWMDR